MLLSVSWLRHLTEVSHQAPGPVNCPGLQAVKARKKELKNRPLLRGHQTPGNPMAALTYIIPINSHTNAPGTVLQRRKQRLRKITEPVKY